MCVREDSQICKNAVSHASGITVADLIKLNFEC